MDAEDLGETTLSKKNRTVIQVQYEEDGDPEDTFRVLMDDSSVEDRKEFILDNATNAHLDI